ncbi:Vacuolar protein sorting-associated protein 13 [Cyberlindnera fabianii]|uniref:Vacuolar protein sorting-associated protein 13 n=1 Tax=Cyberlindnera fabianii TaxID=36022 RepID=A0A1V2LCH8_CYBFA|nr:Vacuolar protein sorting-associated protein 13 [Cyberlindnera fabianii]
MDLELRTRANPTNAISDEDAAKNESFTESLVTKIVDNLQVTIKNIHVRYEDVQGAFTDSPYAIGVVLKELSGVSTDENWSPTFISVATHLTHKLLTLNSLCAYWNTDSASIYTDDHDELLKKFKASIINEENMDEFDDTQFLLRPVTGSGHLTLNKLGSTATQPHIKTEVFFEEFSLDLDSHQYRDALLSASRFHWYNKTHKFKRFRPTVPLEGHAKEWFRYAAESVLSEIHEKNYRWSWDYLRQRRDDRKAYIGLWKQKLKLPDISQDLSDAHSNKALRELEVKLPYEDIKFFRSLARSEMRKERLAAAESDPASTEHQPQQTTQARGGWFSSWWSKSSGESSEDKLVMTDEQREEFYDAIEFDETKALSDAINVPRDRVNFELSAQLKRGGISIKSKESNNALAKVIWEGCSGQHFQRVDSFLSTFTLQEFKVEDGTGSTLYKNVVSVKPLNSDLEMEEVTEPFFKVSLENNPLKGIADVALMAKLRSMTIFYHVDFINEIIKFFTPPKAHLDTINAIMNAAEATVHGLTAQTRMGLEAMWENHKVIDAKLDLQAPLIILPLNPNSWTSPCAVIDAGHISVISDLTDTERTKAIKKLSPEEYDRIDINELKALMYDKFNLHLQDTQVLIGPTIRSTVEQLHSGKESSSLVLDKLDMKILAEISMLPNSANLAKFKTKASLPRFVAKMNDYQYKIMMQLIDKCIPDFSSSTEDIDDSQKFAAPFDVGLGMEDSVTLHELSPPPDSEDSGSKPSLEKQHIFELNFDVEKVQLSLLKCTDGKTMAADPVVDLVAERFSLEFFKTETDMHVDLVLATFNIEDWVDQTGPAEFRKLISSNNFLDNEHVDTGKDIFKLKYDRVRRLVNLDGKDIELFDQDVDLKLSTLKGVLTLKSFMTILNFILTTFTDPNPPEQPSDALRHNDASDIETSPQQIRCNVNLDGITLVLNDDGIKLATIQLSTALFDIFVLPEKMKVYCKLGALTLHDDVNEGTSRDSVLRKLLSFEGDELAEFTYETYDAVSNPGLGYSSSFDFTAGSLRLNFVDEPLNKVLGFFNKFQQMKSYFDSARDSAFNQVNLQDQNMKLDFTIKTPIIMFPKIADFKTDKYDDVTVYLGEFHACNSFVKEASGYMNKMDLGLRSTKLTSSFHTDDGIQSLNIIDEVDISFDIELLNGAVDRPAMKAVGEMTNVSADLTAKQLSYIYALLQSVPKVFEFDNSKSLSEIEDAAMNANQVIAPNAVYHADKDVVAKPSTDNVVEGDPDSIKVDFSFSIPEVSLSLHESPSSTELVDTGITTLSLSDIGLTFSQSQDTHFKSDIHIGSLTAKDIRQVKDNKFTEIIPKIGVKDHQFSARISTDGPVDNKNTIIMATVNSPKVIFAIEYLFALKCFIDEGLTLPSELVVKSEQDSEEKDYDESLIDNTLDQADSDACPTSNTTSRLGFSLNVVDTSLILLADPTSESTEAIVFKIEQLLASKQNVSTASANNVGMFLCKMDNFEGNRIRIIDDFSSSVVIDGRGSTADNYLTSIQIAVEPLLLRVSVADIKLALSIFNKAAELSKSADDDEKNDTNAEDTYTTFTKEFKRKVSQYAPSIVTSLSGGRSRRGSAIQKDVIIKAEELNADIEGLRLVIIGNVNELPVLDMCVEPFQLVAKNWSTDMEVDGSIQSFVNIFNYAKSSWEPLVEPWPFAVHISKTMSSKQKLSVDFIARKIAEVTLSSRSIALLSNVFSSISGNGEIQGRGGLKPYKILNETGFDINVWVASSDDSRTNLTTIKDGETTPWEFEDWKKVRENLDTDNNKGVLGIEFLDSTYDQLLSVPVTSEGEELYMLTPSVGDYHNRLSADVKLGDDNVKTITLRSTVVVENGTQVHVLIKGKKEYKILAGESRAIPIDEVYDTSLLIKPDIKVPFGWSNTSISWKRITKGPMSLRCPSADTEDTTSFFFQVDAQFDKNEPLTKVYPHMKVVLSAPLEIENLLPYDMTYRLYDRSSKRDWRNFLKKGSTSPVHVVKLEHFLLLSVQPVDTGFAKSDFAIINAPDSSEFKRETRLCLKHEDSQTLKLGIHYSTSHSGAGLKVTVFSPYVILNRTSRELFVRENYNTLHSKVTGDDVLKTTAPMMFSFNEEADVKSRALVKFGDSGWSKPVSFHTIGQISQVDMVYPDKKTSVSLGVTVNEGEGKYKLTNVVTLAPRYLLTNKFSQEIECLVVGSSEPFRLTPGEHRALYGLPMVPRNQIMVRLLGGKSEWSSPFNIKDVGQIHLKTYRHDVGVVLFKVDVMLEEASLFIHIADAENHWPFSIRNFSDHEFLFYQSDPNVDENEEVVQGDGREFKPLYYRIPPKSVMPYAWDHPAGIHKELVLRASGRERRVQLAEIGSLRPMKLPKANAIVDLNVIADGPTQTLVISNYDPSLSLYKLSDSQTASNVSVADSDRFNVADESMDISTHVVFKFEGLGVSLINTRLQELCYISVNGIELRFNDSEIYQTFSWKLKWLQIDNQLFGGIFPIVLYPTVLPQSTKEMNNHPAFSGSVTKVKDDTHGVIYIKYLTLLLQEMSIEIDEDFLFALLDFSKIPGAGWNKEVEDRLCDEVIQLPEPSEAMTGSDVYFEALHLQPVQMNLSFVRTERINVEDKSSSQNAIMFFLNVLTMAIGNINDASIRLNALLIDNVRTPIPTLIQHIQTHYGQAFFSQIHRVLGSADVIGNPVGLFNNISSGVMDIFYEPYQGFVMTDRPQELGIGLAKGGLSFLKKTVFGFSDSFAKVTGSIAKGLTAATLDKDFQERRRLTQRRNKPKHALYGFSNGATSFVDGITSGITGIALGPVQGASKEGASGFFKGIGKGLIGLPTKTAIGVFDLASQVGEGIKNSTTAFDGDGLDKVRLPRHVARDSVIEKFNEREAQGQFWLKMAGGGEFLNEDYVAHVVLPGEELAVIVTYKLILMMSTATLGVNWSISFDQIKSITQEKTGIKIGLNSSRQGPFIPLPHAESRRFLYKNIGVAVNEYNKNCQVVP